MIHKTGRPSTVIKKKFLINFNVITFRGIKTTKENSRKLIKFGILLRVKTLISFLFVNNTADVSKSQQIRTFQEEYLPSLTKSIQKDSTVCFNLLLCIENIKYILYVIFKPKWLSRIWKKFICNKIHYRKDDFYISTILTKIKLIAFHFYVLYISPLFLSATPPTYL